MRILYLDLDTLRPDHLGCYGYGRNTSPNIDKIAEKGIRFDNYYCSDAPCLPSRTALMTGRFGIQNGVVNHGGLAAELRPEGSDRKFRSRMNEECLPGFLRGLGFRTISISPFAERHSAWWFYAGFQEMYNTGECGQETAEKISPVVLDWLRRNAQEDNWFLHVNFWDAHTPYRVPMEFGNPFAEEEIPDLWISEETFHEHQKMAGPHTAMELNMYHGDENPKYPRNPGQLRKYADLRRVFDGYDTGIRYMDAQIGLILEELERQGILEDMAIIISSDHGENLGELGIYSEHATADFCTARIPMIIKWPGGLAGTSDNGLHYNLDLPPTLAQLMGKAPCKSWSGDSYAGTVLSGQDCGREYLVLSQCAHVCQRSVRFGRWLYIRSYHDGYHLFPKEMLFDLESDPHEQNNLAGQYGDVCREAVYMLNEWYDSMMETLKGQPDPMWTVLQEGGPYHVRVGDFPKYCERLENTGRGDAARLLKEKYGGQEIV